METILISLINRLGRGLSRWLGEPGNRARFAMLVRWVVWLPAAVGVVYCVTRAVVAYNDDPTSEVWRGWLTWAAAVGLAPTSLQFLFWLRDQARRPDVYLWAEEYAVDSVDQVPTPIHTMRVNLIGRVVERAGEHPLTRFTRAPDGSAQIGFEVVVSNRGTARVSDGLVNVLAPVDCQWSLWNVAFDGNGSVRIMPPAHSGDFRPGEVTAVRYVAFERDFPPNHDIITRLVLTVPPALEEVEVVIGLDGEPNHHRRTRLKLRLNSATKVR